MACIINASTSNGLVNSADGSGQLKVQSNGVTTNALAWVNFNGTGTVAIRSSYNVSSITDNGTGDYTLNFTTALSDANYAAVANAGQGTNSDVSVCGYRETISTSAYRMKTIASNGSAYVDAAYVGVIIFGN